MFASKSPEGWNHDPEPVLYPDGVRTDGCGWLPLPDDGIRLAPRPEFDHVQHNAPNPILAYGLREAVAQDAQETPPITDIRDTAGMILAVLDEEFAESHTPEQVEHARRVLARLAQIGA